MLHELAKNLNRTCHCVGTDVAGLRNQLDSGLQRELSLGSSHPHLFSELPVFVSEQDQRAMQAIIQAVESVVAMPAYQARALAPHAGLFGANSNGGILGYDFHITGDGPKLIEINTNPGGALLAVEMLKAQLLCCDLVRGYLNTTFIPDQVERQIVDAFRRDWARVRGSAALKAIAIVDESPAEQYLFPEFLLFQQLFRRHGIEAVIASPSELRIENGTLLAGNLPIDLVYNRLTDFYLQDTANNVLLEAHIADLVVMTPHPRAHALYANKSNLVTLTSSEALLSIGVSDDTIGVLRRGIPNALAVNEADASQWWAQRKDWFFKPESGFGSKGTYRGDKITRSVFANVLRDRYVAQQVAPPSERAQNDWSILKFDIRNYTYEGNTILSAARLYQGQTTNFRTAGGGFAPIYVVDQAPQ